MTAALLPARRPIRRLSPTTIERIAAGEVVERPASVVKELVENAIDAGATEIIVRLGGGGFERIEVADDGIGIRPTELPLALERYATSKIEDDAGLASVRTLGFRGEALASIASVARLRIVSRIDGSDEGAEIEAVGGTTGAVAPAGRPVGTTVEVRDLFYNTPARRKFLKSPAAEQVEVAGTLERLYLAVPSVGLSLSLDDGAPRRFVRTASLADAAARVFGVDFFANSFAIDAGLASGARLEAVLGRPVAARATSTSLHLAVNSRAIVSRPIAQAIRAAYADLLPRARFPVGAVRLTVPPSAIDVNVHPTKREIRFEGERTLLEEVRVAVRRALLDPSRASLASPAPEHPAAIYVDLPPATAVSPERRGFQRTIVSEGAPEIVAPIAGRAGLRILGCVGALYWLAEQNGGAVIIDQHAASERLLFDLLRAGHRPGRQELLEPVLLTLGPKQRTALDAHADEVRAAGYSVEPFGGDAFRLTAVPEFLGRRAPPDGLVPLLDEIAAGGRPTLPDGLVDRVAASIACHAAVRAGDRIEPTELTRILDRLFSLPGPTYACPHGRPVVVELPRSRLDRWFLRAGA